jgi:hypothetical protein
VKEKVREIGNEESNIKKLDSKGEKRNKGYKIGL